MKSVVIILSLSEKSKDVAATAVKSLQLEGFAGPVLVVNKDSFKDLPELLSEHPAQKSILFARPAVILANLSKIQGVKEALDGADSVAVIHEDVMVVKDPTEFLGAMKSNVLYAPAATVNFSYLASTLKVPDGLKEKPALLTDVIAFKPGAEVQALFDSWAKSTITKELFNDELLLNSLAIKNYPQIAYFPADVFTGNKEYHGPFVMFRDKWEEAIKWHNGRATKAPPAKKEADTAKVPAEKTEKK